MGQDRFLSVKNRPLCKAGYQLTSSFLKKLTVSPAMWQTSPQR
jgi:hypothetical protein